MTTLLVAGTASHVGKSTVAAGLCRLLAERGVEVAPFKAQNMSTNARVAPRPAAVRADEPGVGPELSHCRRPDEDESQSSRSDDVGSLYGEIGVAQYTQARAAGVPPSTDHNPVLLKPRGDGESQLLLDGRPVGHVGTETYYEGYWEHARETALAAHDRLADRAEVIVAEGAGSIAEINLHDRDLPNVELARATDARVLVVVDIERGGAFAHLYGTLELLPADVRERVVGAIVTKFRGDRSLLEPGITEIERRTGVPVLAVLPHDDPGLPDEDSLSMPAEGVVRGVDDVPEARATRIVVPKLPRLAQAGDLDPLAEVPGVRVAIRPPAAAAEAVADADAVVLPGTKNAVAAARAAREAGLGEALTGFSGPIVGICGGYQLMGRRLHRADREAGGPERSVPGLGVLDCETTFAAEKTIRRVERSIEGRGPIAGASGTVAGFEIHAGETTVPDGRSRPLGPESVATGRVLGTYLHGLFEHAGIRSALLDAAGHDGDRVAGEAGRPPIDRAADLLRGRGILATALPSVVGDKVAR